MRVMTGLLLLAAVGLTAGCVVVPGPPVAVAGPPVVVAPPAAIVVPGRPMYGYYGHPYYRRYGYRRGW